MEINQSNDTAGTRSMEVPVFIVHGRYNEDCIDRMEYLSMHASVVSYPLSSDTSNMYLVRDFVIDGMNVMSIVKDVIYNRAMCMYKLLSGIIHIHGEDSSSTRIISDIRDIPAPGVTVMVFIICECPLQDPPIVVDELVKQGCICGALSFSITNSTVARWYNVMRDEHTQEITSGHTRIFRELIDAQHNECL